VFDYFIHSLYTVWYIFTKDALVTKHDHKYMQTRMSLI